MSTEINIRKKIDIQEEGVSITPDVNSINFIGAGVTASTVGDNVTVNVQGSIGATAYYLNETVTQAPYKEFSSIPTAAAEQTIATVIGVGATATIQSFQTPSGVPNTTNIPAGLWQFYLHFSGTAGDSWDVYAEVYKRDLGGIETLLLTTDVIPTTVLSAIPTMILTDGVFPASTVLTTDRIVVKILATNTGVAGQTITFHTEGSTNYSVGTTTLNQVVPTGAVSAVTGTAPVVSSGGTTPAISMAQANGTTDGYLDSADWTTFNNKVDDNIYTADGTVAGTRTVDLDGNTINFNDGKLGVNITPTAPLHVQTIAVPSANESIARFTVSDAAGAALTILNASSADGRFVPEISALQGLNTDNAFKLTSYIQPTQDSGSTPITVFSTALSTLTPIVTRPLYQFRNAGTSLLTILADGKVGIGTTTPTEKLEVSGKTKTTTFQMTTTPTAGYVLTSDASGNGSWSAAAGGLTYFTEAQSTAAPNATVPVDSLTAVSAATNADIAIVPKGNGAFTLQVADNTVAGGNKRGANAIDLSTKRVVNTDVASGASSIVIGERARATNTNSFAVGLGGLGAISSGNSSVAIGAWTTATGNISFAVGNRVDATGLHSVSIGGYQYGATTASGESSFASGGATASGDYSLAIGPGNIANGRHSVATGTNAHTFGISGRRSHSAGREATDGDSQASKFILRERTTGNTATTLTSDSNAGGTANQVILSNQSAYGFTGTIVGKQSGSTNAAMWKVEGLIARGANAASTVLTTSTITLVSNAPAWGTPTLAADVTNGGLQVQVIGAAATNIQWTATIDTTEVIYA